MLIRVLQCYKRNFRSVATSSATGVTVEGYNPMLESRKEELSYTDTGNGWSMRNLVKPLPVDEVMAVLHNHYDAGATLTDEMINHRAEGLPPGGRGRSWLARRVERRRDQLMRGT
eukprot:COSAG02_NODE_10003_length_2053_cov_2.514841_2_plen_115_part_00